MSVDSVGSAIQAGTGLFGSIIGGIQAKKIVNLLNK